MDAPAEPPHPQATPAPSGALFAAGAAALVAFYVVGAVYLGGFALDLGSLNLPTPGYLYLVAVWSVFGALAAGLFALGAARRWGSVAEADGLLAQWSALSDRRFLLWTCGAGLALPLLLRWRLLQGAPLADDESAYRFAAELLASGRLWVASPKLKLFFDQNFMINDGRLYPVYFLGWPALLAPAVWVGATALVNPLCSALTVPPLYGALRHWVGTAWARLGVLLFLAAPMLQIAAATLLAHTSCFAALTWGLWLFLRTREPGARPAVDAAFAFSLALAFCIRPQSALPLALPLVVAWALALRPLGAAERRRRLVAFALPALALAALFLGSLWAQNGSPFRVGYAAAADYMQQNGFRFTTFRQQDLTQVAGFDFGRVGPAIARATLGIFRLNFDLFGWPSSLALVLLALPAWRSRARLLWAMAGCYLLFHLFERDWGIDTFAPLHAFELALPVLCLTLVGAQNLGRRLAWAQSESSPRWRWEAFAPALLAALVVTAWLGFVPVRLAAVRQIATQLHRALDAPAAANLHRAVIFAPFPFAPPCGGTPNHFVLFRPVNDPALENDVLWVNHLDVARDHELLDTLPGRSGHLMQWTADCDVRLVPLADAAPAGAEPPPS